MVCNFYTEYENLKIIQPFCYIYQFCFEETLDSNRQLSFVEQSILHMSTIFIGHDWSYAIPTKSI